MIDYRQQRMIRERTNKIWADANERRIHLATIWRAFWTCDVLLYAQTIAANGNI